MKRSKKIMLMAIPMLLLVVALFAGNVFATATTTTNPNAVGTDWPDADSNGIGNVNNTAKKVWGTLLTIFQILAIAAIVIAGVRYMFASADQKADIKKSMVILVLGAALVFGASTIAKFIQSTTADVLKTTDQKTK